MTATMRDGSNRPLRTVWIVGAGFSRSLGGPLLPDILRQELLRDLEAKYPSARFGDLALSCFRAQALFNYGKHIEGAWDDAEEFLDFVDSTEAGSPSEQALMRMATTTFRLDAAHNKVETGSGLIFESADGARSGVIRAVASACSWFVRSRDTRPERWAPYEAWIASLEPDFDTVVTFNYDHVIEVADDGRVAVALPSADPAPGVQLLKLHGSVTWLRNGASCRIADLDEVLASPRDSLAIGTPGRTKRIMKDALFEPLWSRAEVALRSAEVVVFLGYRFPQTDGDARRRVLEAIRSNSCQRLRLQVILGSNAQSPDAIRVQRLLELTGRGLREIFLSKVATPYGPPRPQTLEIFAEPLFVEDFLALYARNGPLSRWG